MNERSTRSKQWCRALPRRDARTLPITSLAAAVVTGAAVTGSAMAQSNGVSAWGRNVEAQCAVPSGLGTVQSIAGGSFHSVALRADGTVVCWGNVAEGQATVPAGLGVVQAIAAGHFHTIALKQNGTVACWGRNVESQCNVPAGLANVIAVSGGWKHSLALKSDGLVAAWGNNSTVSQTPPASLSGVTRIAAGSQHNIALRSNGTVTCWGAGTANTGISPNFGQAAPPAGLGGVTRIAAGQNHSAALKSDGTVVCWGQNTNQQTSVPAGLGGVVAIAAGNSHTIALRSNGTVAAWGLNTSGQTTVPAGLGVATGLGAGGQHTLAVVASAPTAVLVSSTPATCSGATGAIDVTVTNATSVAWSGPGGFSSSSVDLASVAAGAYTLVASGPGGSTTLNVTVAAAPDVTAPVVTSYTTSSAVDSDGTCNALVPDLRGSVVASDNCTPAGALQITQSPAAGTSVGLGVTPITLTVRDAAGNSVNRQATFNVNGHAQVCFVDADADTFGNPASATAFCNAPPGWVTNDDDCDDDDSYVHPGSDEQCDSEDDDCDNLVDEDLPVYTYFPDADGDGFGNGRSPLQTCESTPPSGFVTNNGDCDDASNLVYPGAAESCANLAVDNDCDGSVSEDEAADRTLFFADADGDGSGDPDVSDLACTAPEGFVANSDDRCPQNPELIERISYYRDIDADGFGDANSRTSVCDTTAPAGFVANSSDCNDSSLLYTDGDGDGFGAGAPAACGVGASGDCNDGDAAIKPSAQEVCDAGNTDEDCDGAADNADTSAADAGKSDFYTDADNDNYGVGSAQRFCDEPANFATVAGDCNDGNAAINPGAGEVCDAGNTDEDCDGFVDDADSMATGKTLFYADVDRDGYTGSTTGLFCDQQPWFEPTNEGDCNDGNAAINPGASEICDAGNTDEDCDGAADNADSSAADAGKSNFYADSDADGFGAGAAVRFCDQPAGYRPTNTDCNDANAAINPSAQEICDPADTDEDCDGAADNADTSAADAGKSNFFVDGDRDTYGAGATVRFCDLPASGYSVNSTDCNDANAAINPAGQEICDPANADEDCDGLADDGDPTATGKSTFYADADRDGFSGSNTGEFCDKPTGYEPTDEGDCNDANGSIRPGASERCNEIDDDCDNVVDEDLTYTSYYRDVDADGYGIGSDTQENCTGVVPKGYALLAGDCNDASAVINPGVTEICDAANTDENCNGQSDDADSGVSDAGRSDFYIDGDGDGFGAGGAVRFCDMPASGYSVNSTDCNNGSSAINPSAQEICDTGNVDEDCDGLADDADSSATGKSTFYRDADSDSYTGSTTGMFCDMPAGYEPTNEGDCNDGNAAINPGAQEICDAANTDEDCDGAVDDADPSAIGKSTFYRDADSDSYTGSTTGMFCDMPAGYEPTNEGDCNDGNAAINPGAQEICDAANTDEDCDGLADDADASVTGKSTFYRDADSDSYTGSTIGLFCDMPAGYESTDEGDCNDGNAAINPGAQEVCDAANVDENCNGQADDAAAGVADAGRSSFYVDVDGDGFGTGAAVRFCDMPATGYSVNATDCNDRAAVINPAAQEVCDAANVDEDCDTLRDDADPSVTGKTAFYADADGDGFSGSATTSFCDMPARYEPTNEGDCNDASTLVYPGAPEACADLAVDNDCDGSVAESEAADALTFYRDADNDGAGDSSETVLACSAPSGYVGVAGDGCPLDGGKTAPGACGCGVPDTDTDSDGTADCNDGCPTDANKTEPGDCGCGVADTDTDGDGTADCNDGCPTDAAKTDPGTCGCGVADVDSDGDGTLDCNDGCPLDADKTVPGICGCGTSDIDSDANGVADCADFIVTLEPEATSVREGNTLKVVLQSTWPTLGSPDRATGIQVVVAYDPTRLSLEADAMVRDSVRSDFAGGPFQRQIFESIDNDTGLLRYAAGIDTGADGMTADAPLIEMTFDVLPGVSECDVAELVRILPSMGAAITRFSVQAGSDSGARLPRLIDMVDIDLDFDGPVIAGVPADAEIPVDAGSLTSGTFLEPTVTASDNCEGARPVTLLVQRPGMTPLTAWPADNRFPIGVSTITWSSVDSAGNTSSQTLSITVGNYQHFNAVLTLNGGFTGTTQRSIRVSIDGVEYGPTQVAFNGRTGTIVDLRVPVATGYGCTLAKNLTHALSDSAVPTIVDREYTASYQLIQGDSNNDDRVDIYDFSLFVTDRGAGKATNARSNFDADTDVDNGDFGFLSWAFFREGETCGGGGALAGGPVSRVSVKDLRRQGLGHLAAADLNGDGWVDLRDIEQYVRAAGPAPTPPEEPLE